MSECYCFSENKLHRDTFFHIEDVAKVKKIVQIKNKKIKKNQFYHRRKFIL